MTKQEFLNWCVGNGETVKMCMRLEGFEGIVFGIIFLIAFLAFLYWLNQILKL